MEAEWFRCPGILLYNPSTSGLQNLIPGGAVRRYHLLVGDFPPGIPTFLRHEPVMSLNDMAFDRTLNNQTN